MNFTESIYEGSVLEVIQDLGYKYLAAEEIERDSYRNPLYMKDLKKSLAQINPELDIDVLGQAIFKLQNIDLGSLVQRNKVFMDWLQNGMEVSYMFEGKEKTSIVYLVDYINVKNNIFSVVNQWTVAGLDQNRRPDIVVFINGLPLVVIELKSGASETADISSAYLQIRNYQLDIPDLFVYNAFNIISDHTYSKAGTITATEEWYKEWKTTDGSYEETRLAAYDVLFKGMLDKARILDIIKNFILFEDSHPEEIKILAQYHQYYAVKKAVASTVEATRSDGRAGVFWHTQGAGKSLSMVFYTKLLYQYLNNPTFVVLTDRIDLDDQLYGLFSRVQDFLRQTPKQAKSREHLNLLLEGRKANGIFFTTMQKFAEADNALSHRNDIIVMTDEAHRSQYGLKEIISSDGAIQIGMAKIIRDSLPKASYIGFTGTPISQEDRDTQEVFGNYIDIYDMTQAVEDGATRPIFYESRVINLGLNDTVLDEIDKKYTELALTARAEDIAKSKRQLSRLEAILGSDTVIETLVEDIVKHYEEERAHLLTGKAMIVAYSRAVAMKIYDEILDLRPDWEGMVKVVVTGSASDPEHWRAVTGSNAYKKELARRFKDDKDPMKIAIVVDMWLTGFDVPSLATMYVFKPMKEHSLMQAIVRVNRVFKDKEGGLIVDYIGIARALKEAMNDYTVRDKENFSNPDIREEIYPKFKEKLEVCRNEFLYGLDYEDIFNEKISDQRRANLITEGINHIYRFKEEWQKAFKQEAYTLRQVHSLCSSISTKEEQREAAFIEAIRIGISRIKEPGQISLGQINRQIEELLKNSIKTAGVINLFSDVDTKFSLFDEEFLLSIAAMKQKNLVIELINKLIKEEIKAYAKTNIVKAEEFSERIRRIMEQYRKSQLENAESLDEFLKKHHEKQIQEIIDELLAMARDMLAADKLGDRIGLSEEETSFYYAITSPESVKDYYEDQVLIEMAKELTRELKQSESIDWQFKQSGRAKMRSVVRRLLKKYNYPPEGVKEALEVVLKQCEHWTENRKEF